MVVVISLKINESTPRFKILQQMVTYAFCPAVPEYTSEDWKNIVSIFN